MVWLIAIASLIFPRIVIVALWLLTYWFNGVFLTWYWPLLGFLFMPHTLLWYSAVQNWYDGNWGFWQKAILIIWIIIDISADGAHANNVAGRSDQTAESELEKSEYDSSGEDKFE